MPWKKEPELNRPLHGSSDEPEPVDDSVRLEAATHGPGQMNIHTPGIESGLAELNRELKRRRRWATGSRLLIWLLALGLLGSWMFGSQTQVIGDHTAMVRLEGIIADGNDASAKNILQGLTQAFESESAKGIILEINSPGGSPVQADMLYREIQRLRAEYDKPLVAVISDVGASGGYYAAVAAETIYANPSSLVGSIGVLMNSFGFVDLMDKIGVKRRLLIAGEHKAALDPFSPLNEDEVAHARTVIEGVHRQFIDVVRSSRGARLKETEQTFSGQFWNGEQAYEMGLTDGFKTPWAVARDDIGEATIVDYTYRPDVFERFTRTLGAAIAKGFTTSLGKSLPELN